MQHNSTVAEYDVWIQDFLSCLPKKRDAVILLADFNVFSWKQVQGEWVSARKDAKWEALKNACAAQGLRQAPPLTPRPNAPTYIARKAGVKSTQIDGVFAAGIIVGQAYVQEERTSPG